MCLFQNWIFLDLNFYKLVCAFNRVAVITYIRQMKHNRGVSVFKIVSKKCCALRSILYVKVLGMPIIHT